MMEYLSFSCGGDTIPDKDLFLASINAQGIFDVEFYKKVCGYSMYDTEYLQQIASKLVLINRKDIIQTYNQWYSSWQQEQNTELKRVAAWYVKECEKKYTDLHTAENKPERTVKKEWTMEELLLKKKKLLLQQRLMKLKSS